MAKWWKPAVKWRFRFVIIMLLQVFLLCYMVEYLNREGDADGLQERYWGLFHVTNVVRGGPSDFEIPIVEEELRGAAEVGSGGKGVMEVMDLDKEDEGEDEEKRRVVRELDSAVKEEKEKGREGERGLEPSDLGGKAEAMEAPKDTEKEAEREQNEERERQQNEDRERQRAKEKMEEEGLRQAAEEVKRGKEEEDEDRAAEAAGFPDWPVGPGGGEAGLEGREACEAWLGDQDEVRHERTFDHGTDPVIVKADYSQSWPQCAAGCRFEVVALEHDAQMGDTLRNCKFPMRRPRSSTTRRAASMAVTALPAPTAIIKKSQQSRRTESRAAMAWRTTQDQIRRSRLRVRRSASQEEKKRAVEFVRWAEKGGVDLFDRRRRSLQAVTPEDIRSLWERGAARGDSEPLDRRRGAGEGWKGGASERGRRVLMEGGGAEDGTGGAARTLYVDGAGRGFATGQEVNGNGGGVGVGLRGVGASAQIVRRCPLTATLTMEPVSYYPQFSLKEAHKNGFDVLMTSNLNSEVPAQYFSWAEYVIMDPLTNKTREALAAAFISNCGANSFREEALAGLMKEGVKIDSWGRCQHNVPDSAPAGSKETLLKDYRFCLAFENSEEDDYVTEKFFQCLVAGSVPVVVGAPTIHDFEPEKDTIIHLQSIKDVPKIARNIIEVNNNLTLWNHMLRWKQQGPSDDFKALMDLSIVHSSCRLCIYTATKIWEQEEIEMGYPRRRPCRCRFHQAGGGPTSHLYHLFVRERGRLNFEQVYVASGNVTLEGLRGQIRAVFEARGHRPIWEETPDRPQVLRPPPGAPLKIHRVYPAHATVRASLFGSAWFRNTAQFLHYLRYNPCPKLEVIFV